VFVCLKDVHVTKGTLVCPESGRKFSIENGVPDMMWVLLVWVFYLLVVSSY